MKNIERKTGLIFIIMMLFISTVFSQVPIPVLKNYANDLTNTLDRSELYTLESKLKSFDDSTTNQVVFLMMSTIDGYPLESFCYETAAKNQIGSKKNNNGVLFFIAKNDRKMRFEIGYGLEGAVPDALASSILRNEVRPYFKAGDYYAGISAGLEAIILATKGEYKREPKGKDKGKGTGIPFIFIVIIFVIIAALGGKGGKGGGSGLLPLLILSSMGGSGRRSGGFGGGSWGGSSGGFGGFSGGGGSFGGGGASGSW